jgi:hypothetical protein
LKYSLKKKILSDTWISINKSIWGNNPVKVC